jgi:ubiquinone/menaquinone biosynthesis C-methylase UbiE
LENPIERGNYFTDVNRVAKAKKILALLSEYRRCEIKDCRIIDIGTGTGEIAEYISNCGNDVTSVDIAQHFETTAEYNFEFVLVKDESLPFEDTSFDIAISNFIGEHTPNQLLHLKEIRRVLKPGGICYFAMPNRLFPYDNHTGTVFLKYLPLDAFCRALKWIGKYQEPVYFLSNRRMRQYFRESGFVWAEQTIKVMREPRKYFMGGGAIKCIPEFAATISPTKIYILQK